MRAHRPAPLRITVQVVEGRFTLDEALQADEVCVMSSTRDLLPVSAVGDARFEQDGPRLARLRKAMNAAARHYV